MKNAIVAVLTFGLLAGTMAVSAAADEEERIEQVVEFEYTGGELGFDTPAAFAGTCLNPPFEVFVCKQIIPPGEEFDYIHIEIEDATGQTVGGFISQQDTNGDGLPERYGAFCGAHADPVPLELPGDAITIGLYPGTCNNGGTLALSTPTKGTIVATFSTLP